MYPKDYFNLFPAFPRNNTVFVAMSFAPEFDHRWNNVIAPAIAKIPVPGFPLVPLRVDSRIIGDSILTEILKGIGNAKLILADVTSIGELGGRPIRSGNVMYEIGIAHATRLPEEVLLFRSDDDELLFDVRNVRVNKYSPDVDPEAAKLTVMAAIYGACQELDQRRNLAVEAAARSLDHLSFHIMFKAIKNGAVETKVAETVNEIIEHSPHNTTVLRLLDSGILGTDLTNYGVEFMIANPICTPRYFSHRLTPFGEAVLKYAHKRLGFDSMEVTQYITDLKARINQLDSVVKDKVSE